MLRASKASKVIRVFREIRGQLDLQGRLVLRVLTVFRVRLDLRVLMEQQAQLGLRVLSVIATRRQVLAR